MESLFSMLSLWTIPFGFIGFKWFCMAYKRYEKSNKALQGKTDQDFWNKKINKERSSDYETSRNSESSI